MKRLYMHTYVEFWGGGGGGGGGGVGGVVVVVVHFVPPLSSAEQLAQVQEVVRGAILMRAPARRLGLAG
jgi:hypothetical protein